MIHDADLFEPIHPGVTADSLTPTVDSLTPTADGGILEGASDLSDALVNANFIAADIYEPVSVPVTADATWPTADSLWPTADGGLLQGARDVLDAEVIAVPIPIPPAVGWWHPLRVVGFGFGVLPQIEGEAFGVVGVAGDASVTLSIAGAAEGEVEDPDELALLMILLAA
jgi:hypothetical protein